MTKGLRSIRPLAPESLRGIEPSIVGKKLPKFEWVDPKTIYVEDAYQRNMEGGNSTALVRKIVAAFNWSHYKPPICVRLPESGNVLVCIDGQHTATGAASHPGVPKIPVMVVSADDVAERAESFVGHNHDRISLTQMATHRARVAHNEPVALAVDRACKAAGAEILPSSVNLRLPQAPGKTIAVGTLRSVAAKDGEAFLARVLRVLVGAKRGPVKAGEIAAAAMVLRGRPAAIDAKLRQVVASRSAELWSVAALERAIGNARKTNDTLAELWTEEIDGVPSRDAKPTPETAAPRQAEAPIRQPEAPVRQPEPAPSKPPAPVAIDGKPAGERFVERNGLRFDLLTRSIQHRGREDVVGADGLRLVAALARVMPAFLPTAVVAKAAFGKLTDADIYVRGVAADSNKTLSGLLLEIREVPKMGWMLADLGA